VAGRAVLAEVGKGHLVGGTIVAGERVAAKELGGPGARRTEIVVGAGEEHLHRRARIELDIAQWEGRQGHAQSLVERVERAVPDTARLPDDQLRQYHQLRELILTCRVSVRRLREQMRRELDALSPERGRVEASRQIHPGVVLHFASQEYEPRPGRGPARYTWDEDRGVRSSRL